MRKHFVFIAVSIGCLVFTNSVAQFEIGVHPKFKEPRKLDMRYYVPILNLNAKTAIEDIDSDRIIIFG